MAVEASTKGRWDRAGVGFELSVERLKGWIGGLSMDLGEQLVLEVGVLDTRASTGRQHG